MQDEGRGTRDEGREQIIFDVDLLFQMCVCRPNLRWAREKIQQTIRVSLMTEDIGSKGSGAYDSRIVLWVMYQMPLADKKHFNYLSHKFGFVVFL